MLMCGEWKEAGKKTEDERKANKWQRVGGGV